MRSRYHAEHAFRDAMWDGTNGWDVVSAVRAETLETFAALERQRVTEEKAAASASDQSSGAASGASGVPATSDAERVVYLLLKEASQREPYSVGSDCKQPRA